MGINGLNIMLTDKRNTTPIIISAAGLNIVKLSFIFCLNSLERLHVYYFGLTMNRQSYIQRKPTNSATMIMQLGLHIFI